MIQVLLTVAMVPVLALGRPAGPCAAGPRQATPPLPLAYHVYLPWAQQPPIPTLAWRRRAPLPAPRSDLGVAASAAGQLYAVGGRQYGGLLGPMEAYDPPADAWTARPDIPTRRWGLGVALGGDGRIYAVGGLAGFPATTVVATVEAYDPTAVAWTARASMPTARHGLGLAEAKDGRLYAIGGALGINGTDPTNVVETYDPASDTWHPRAPMPTPRGALAVATGADGLIYAIGGADHTTSPPTFFATVEAYDPATDRWTARAAMPTARAELAVVAAPNGRLYAMGGNSTLNDWLATVEEYDPATDTWRGVEPLGVARRGLAAAVAANGRIYAVGGRYFAPRGDLNVVEEAVLGATP